MTELAVQKLSRLAEMNFSASCYSPPAALVRLPQLSSSRLKSTRRFLGSDANLNCEGRRGKQLSGGIQGLYCPTAETMISPCWGCDLQTLTFFASWYCFIWDVLMIALNCYGIYAHQKRRRMVLKQQAATFVPQAGNTIDLSELECARERIEKPRSRLWTLTGLGLSILDMVTSVLFIQGVNECHQQKILIWCVGHMAISYSAIILTILAVKCNIRVDNREKPVGFSVWNILYMIVDLYLLWIGVSFLGGLKKGFGEDREEY